MRPRWCRRDEAPGTAGAAEPAGAASAPDCPQPGRGRPRATLRAHREHSVERRDRSGKSSRAMDSPIERRVPARLVAAGDAGRGRVGLQGGSAQPLAGVLNAASSCRWPMELGKSSTMCLPLQSQPTPSSSSAVIALGAGRIISRVARRRFGGEPTAQPGRGAVRNGSVFVSEHSSIPARQRSADRVDTQDHKPSLIPQTWPWRWCCGLSGRPCSWWWCCWWQGRLPPRCGAGGGAGRGPNLSQGDGGFADHRRKSARPPRPHSVWRGTRRSAPWWATAWPSCAWPRRTPYRAVEQVATYQQRQAEAGNPAAAACIARGATRDGVHAQERRAFPVMVYERRRWRIPPR